MDFLEDMELYSTAMDNAYNLITCKLEVEVMFIEFEVEYEDDILPLPFNPFILGDPSDAVIDIVIEHFSNMEEYEKCAELVDIKNNNAKKH